MADNYLEKRMDDYARGRTTGPGPRSASRPRLKYPRLTVAVLDADDAAEIISTFVSVGCTVLFTTADADAGRRMAQTVGGRYYPGGVEQITERGEAVDVAVMCGATRWPGRGRRIRLAADQAAADEVVLAGRNMPEAALLCLALAHPSSTVTVIK